MNIKNKILIGLMLFWVSCSKEIDYPIPYDGDKLVLLSFLGGESPVTAKITHSIAPTGYQEFDLTVKDASVNLYEDNEKVETLVYDTNRKIYKSPTSFIPRIGKSYHFEVSAETHPDIQTEQVLLLPEPDVVDFTFEDNISLDGNNNAVGRLDIDFQDADSRTDYYSFEVIGYHNNEPYINILRSVNNDIEGTDICDFDWTIFSDICFDGELYTLSLDISMGNSNGSNEVEFDYIDIHFNAISEGFYSYEKTIYEEEGFFTVFAEPAPLYSNVEGGYGILGVKSGRIVRVWL